ncbi:MAG: radical SAM protein [Proteobacteria bacterium]|nr:radical SAM protein [Pseudomonadota bacterium]
MLERCGLCGHACGADRSAGQTGPCGAGDRVRLAAHLLHFGEEPPISGRRGSGTVFFSGCPLTCVFCQNHQISQQGRGRPVDDSELAEIMLDLQDRGAHNINLVSPTPWVPQILAALARARERGLNLPLVYNTGGFDSPAALKLLDGLIDVYLPDAKYADEEAADRYSGAENYPAVNRRALEIMHRQAGHLETDDRGLAVRGLLIRHLVLPGGLAGTDRVLADLAGRFGTGVWLSLMAQYRPCHRAAEFPELSRGLTEAEYDAALDAALDLGLENVFVQELDASETYLPDFETSEVFSRTE